MLGEQSHLFPAMGTDRFGPQYATANLSVLYTAKGVAPSRCRRDPHRDHRRWNSVLLLAAGIYVVGTILVLAVLRPGDSDIAR